MVFILILPGNTCEFSVFWSKKNPELTGFFFE